MPSLTDEQIELLAEKKLSGTITPEEQTLLDQWLSRKPGDRMVWTSGDADEVSLKKRLLNRIKEDAGISGGVTQTRRIGVLHQYRRMAAAILLSLAAGGAGFIFLFERRPNPPELANQNAPVQDIAPGSTGAILTLADGTKVLLDSTGNGDIAVQGMSRLMKRNDQLIYEKSTALEASGNSFDADEAVAYNTMTTPRGRQFNVILSDGSTVWLNAASSIIYPSMFTGPQRKVIVTGEAYFEVAQDVDRPFVVQLGTSSKDAKITVLGTHFNVMAYPDEKQVETTLMEGSVRVTKGTGQVIITPGQQARFSPASDHIFVADVEADRANAWVNGKMSLDNLDVEAIMRQVSRWYNVDVEFEGPAPSKEHFWGMINRKVYLTSMLEVMRANGINVRLEGKKVIVSSN